MHCLSTLPLFQLVGCKLMETQSWYTGRELNGALVPHLVFINYFSLYLCFLAILGDISVHNSCFLMWVCRLNILEFPDLGRKAMRSRYFFYGWICICFSVGKRGLFHLGSYVNPLSVFLKERTLWHECSGNFFWDFYGILAHRVPFLSCSQWETGRPSYVKM